MLYHNYVAADSKKLLLYHCLLLTENIREICCFVNGNNFSKHLVHFLRSICHTLCFLEVVLSDTKEEIVIHDI
jgi:hypothetical protein